MLKPHGPKLVFAGDITTLAVRNVPHVKLIDRMSIHVHVSAKVMMMTDYQALPRRDGKGNFDVSHA